MSLFQRRGALSGMSQAFLALLLVFGLAIAAGALRGTNTPKDSVLSTSNPASVGPGVERLTPAVIPEMQPSSISAVRGTVLVVGDPIGPGNALSNAAFTYQTGSAELKRITPPPFDPPAAGIRSVGARNGVVVIGTACENLAAASDDQGRRSCVPGSLVAAYFDVNSEAWTRLDPPNDVGFSKPNDGETGVAIGFDGTSAVFEVGNPGTLIAYDESAASWRRLSRPTERSASQFCLAGDQLVGWSSRPDQQLGQFDELSPELQLVFSSQEAAWTKIDPVPWEALGVSSAPPASSLRVHCGLDNVIVADFGLRYVASYDFSEARWSSIPTPPILTDPSWGKAAPVFLNQVVLGTQLNVWPSSWPWTSGFRYDAGTGAWQPVSLGPELIESVDGQALVGGSIYYLAAPEPGARELMRWTPAAFDGALPGPPRVSDNVGTVDDGGATEEVKGEAQP